MFQKCPKPEVLLEYISIPKDISRRQKFQVKWHARGCAHCQKQIETIRASWNNFLTPEVDITSSLLRVYSKLQKDETLILKGWKLNYSQRPKDAQFFLFGQGWLFRGAVAAGVFGMVTYFATVQLAGGPGEGVRLVQDTPMSRSLPLAQIRIEEKDRVKVHYLEPELLQSIEFETTGSAR